MREKELCKAVSPSHHTASFVPVIVLYCRCRHHASPPPSSLVIVTHVATTTVNRSRRRSWSRTAVEPEVERGENAMEERKEGAVPFVAEPQPPPSKLLSPSPLLGHHRRKFLLLELAETAWGCYHSSWFCLNCVSAPLDAWNGVMATGTTA